MRGKVRIGEVNGLLALRRNRDAAHDDVTVAVFYRFKNHAPEGVHKLHLKALSLGDLLHQIDVKADDFLRGRLEFERTVGCTRADRVFNRSGIGGTRENRGGGGCHKQIFDGHRRQIY